MEVLFKEKRLDAIEKGDIAKLLRMVIRLIIENRFFDMSQIEVKKVVDLNYKKWIDDYYTDYSRELNNTMYLYAIYKRLEND